MIAERIRRIGLSPTLRISALATQMRDDGIDVLDFSAGQPDFPTPEGVKEAGKRAIDADLTRYTPNPGLLELRRSIAATIERDYGIVYEPEQILVSPGAKASIYFACQTLLESGDEVLLPTPYWVSYPEQIRLAQAEPIFVPCSEENGFKLTAAELEQYVTPRTRLLILNYPSNPTGACYDRDELAPLAELCVRREIRVLADEIYSKLIYDGREFTAIASLGEAIRDRTVLIDGMSKTYSMTGWRVGYAAGPRDVIDGMGRLQSHSTSNVTSISQWATIEALGSPRDEVERRRDAFQERRDEIVRRLSDLPGVRCVMPEGAFYVFPNVSGCFCTAPDGERIDSGEALAGYLLREARVAVVPGDAFGAREHVRISYAASIDRIREGMDRIERALGTLRD
jgi:aspartate aminotransferase